MKQQLHEFSDFLDIVYSALIVGQEGAKAAP
jgi:hypothetical protein